MCFVSRWVGNPLFPKGGIENRQSMTIINVISVVSCER